jgi:hypothetical protein
LDPDGPGLAGEGFDFLEHAGESVIRQNFQFFPSRRLNLD